MRKLIAGPAICDECIQLANETTAGARSESDTTTLPCSFCGKSPLKVKMLVAAETTHICNECIGLCSDIIAGQKRLDPLLRLSVIAGFWRRRPSRRSARTSASGDDPGNRTVARGQDATPALTCSFCRKSRLEVRKLIAGPTACVCDECIQLANETTADARSEGDTTTLRCSFCGKSPPKVKMLVAEEITCICNECTGLCSDIIAE